MDSMIPATNARQFESLLKKAGAEVQHRTLPAGHGLSQADLTITRDFLQRNTGAAITAA
jgi:phospholipase/carboxylesterase